MHQRVANLLRSGPLRNGNPPALVVTSWGARGGGNASCVKGNTGSDRWVGLWSRGPSTRPQTMAEEVGFAPDICTEEAGLLFR